MNNNNNKERERERERERDKERAKQKDKDKPKGKKHKPTILEDYERYMQSGVKQIKKKDNNYIKSHRNIPIYIEFKKSKICI